MNEFPVLQSNGVLFIGDPHLSSRKPQRRMDNYTQAILDKLKESIGIANKNKWIPVFMGDLFDRPRDTEPAMLCDLIQIMQSSFYKPIVLVGNHDKVGFTLSKDTALAVIAISGCIDLVDKPRVIAHIKTPENLEGFLIYGVPYGFEIPLSLNEFYKGKSLPCIMITHHDLAIGEATYPGAKEPLEIKGVNMVVNGHDHKPKPLHDVGQTRYYNIGNISRLTIDQFLSHHAPSVFSWDGHDMRLLGTHELKYVKNVFDTTGYNAHIKKCDDPTSNIKLNASGFANLLSEDNITHARSSDEGSDIEVLLDAIIEERYHKKNEKTGLKHILKHIFDTARQQKTN